MYNYNIPRNGNFNQRNYNNQPYNSSYSYQNLPLKPNFDNNDRFFGGGFLGPFLLGGVGGYLLGRPNYNGPIPVYFPGGVPYQQYGVPYYQSNFYY